MAGYIELEKANIKWFLSTDRNDLPHNTNKARRILSINNEIVDFSEGFTDLHTKVYEEIMKGNGFRIKDAKPAISLVYKIRNTEIEKNPEYYHPFVQKYIEMERENSKNKE